MTGVRRGLSAAECLLVLVSLTSAAAAGVAAIRAVPDQPAVWMATSVALGLALATAAVVWFARVADAQMASARLHASRELRALVSALPACIAVIERGCVLSVNRRFSELVGYGHDELVGAQSLLPFWPPEHRHEVAEWFRVLARNGSHAGELVLLARDGRRIASVVAGNVLGRHDGDERFVLVVRDVSESTRREQRLADIASRDLETALLNERGLEERLGEVVRRALVEGAEASVVVAELGGAGDRPSRPGSPEALAVERLQALIRADDELAQTSDGEVVWILPRTDVEGAMDAVSRARAAISDLGVAFTAGVCDLASAGDAPSLYALADRALADARRNGRGTTARHLPADEPAEHLREAI